MEYFTKIFEGLVSDDIRGRGPDEPTNNNFLRLSNIIISKVIPRLLLPLESGGSHIEPVLCHGDIWVGNVGTDTHTGEVMLFDAGVFWGHNESE